jgi:putative ABC transport system substrate-binding protein
MGPIGLAVVLTVSLVLEPLAAEPQQTEKVYRLGYLEEGSAKAPLPGYGWLKQGLRDLGWTEGENLVVEARFTEGKPERLAAVVAEPCPS